MSSANVAVASDPSSGAVQKHRACDECRTRKLACTKEPDGCSRCKREGIACHYSPQKPMGRPRKRPRDQANETPADDTTTATTTTADDAPAPKTVMTELPPETTDPGMEFINFLTGDFNFGHQHQTLSADADAMLDAPEKGSPWRFGYTGYALGDLNFDADAVSLPQDQASYPPTNIDPALFVSADPPPPVDSVPSLSPPSAAATSTGTPESSTSTGGGGGGSSSSNHNNNNNNSTNPTTCACTASLYLALDSMQKLPPDVTDGVRQARSAARTAYQVVNCPACAISVDAPPTPPPPSAVRIHNFQNLMLLGTLIPSIVHAYERILAAVDREAAGAQRERRRLVFRLRGLGGIWGALGRDGGDCGVSQAFDRREMEPAMWRLTVRALLKLDVYGLYGDENCGRGAAGLGPGDPLHLGLKDIVTMMENRSRARHAVMDAMVLSGAWPEPPCSLKLYRPGETPTCQQIISIAKMSIDRLVIA